VDPQFESDSKEFSSEKGRDQVMTRSLDTECAMERSKLSMQENLKMADEFFTKAGYLRF
jgi:hypothetical protein